MPTRIQDFHTPQCRFKLEGNNGWEDAHFKEKNMQGLVLSFGNKLIECKWIFVVKQKMDGIVYRYKVQLVGM